MFFLVRKRIIISGTWNRNFKSPDGKKVASFYPPQVFSAASRAPDLAVGGPYGSSAGPVKPDHRPYLTGGRSRSGERGRVYKHTCGTKRLGTQSGNDG